MEKTKNMDSQRILIKKHLIRYGSINPLEALQKYGCFRLAARISDLRNEGLEIKTDNSNKYAIYKLGPQLTMF